MSQPPLNVSVPQTLDLLKTRRSGSAKTMKGPGPSPQQIHELISCATRVPDHGKLAPWRFILIQNEERIKAGEILASALLKFEPTASEERLAQEQNRFTRAPLVIAVISKAKLGLPIPEWEQILSAGACCQTLCIAAHAMGFVANWITEWYAYDPNVKAAFGLDPNERFAGFVYVGHPREPLVDRPRPDWHAVVKDFSSI